MNASGINRAMHKILVYLAIVGILLCPYDCAVREAAARATNGDAKCSSCCHHCPCQPDNCPAHSEDPSDQEGPCDDGRSCLCEGAVFDVSARSMTNSLLEFSLWAPAVDSAETPRLTEPDWYAQRMVKPPPADGGRQLRIVVQSFLL